MAIRSNTTARNSKKAAEYTALAAKRITSPSAVAPQRPPSVLVYARNKQGKTRFCLSPGKGNVLIIDPERGTDRFLKADPDVWHVSHWLDLDDVYKFLKYGDHSYKYCALDGTTRMANMALRFVMEQAEERDISRKPGMVTQRDYGKAGELFKGMLYNFHTLDIGVIYTAHERLVTNEFEEEDDDVEESDTRFVPDLPAGIRSSLNAIVDVVGRLYTVRVPSMDGDQDVIQRRLWLAPSVTYDTGARSEYHLPDYLPNPSVRRLVNLLNGKRASNGNEAVRS